MSTKRPRALYAHTPRFKKLLDQTRAFEKMYPGTMRNVTHEVENVRYKLMLGQYSRKELRELEIWASRTLSHVHASMAAADRAQARRLSQMNRLN